MPRDFKHDPITGDLIPNGKGGFVHTMTAETSVRNQLLARYGECWQDPELGSRLHDRAALQANPAQLATAEAARALSRLEDAGRISAVEVRAEESPGRVTVATRFADTTTNQLVETFVAKTGGR